MHVTTLLTAAFLAGTSHACSRVAYNSGDLDCNRITVGRSMDWLQFPNSSIWAFPAGLHRTGNAGANSISWTSKYGSVVTSMYDLAIVDGMNTAGLAGTSSTSPTATMAPVIRRVLVSRSVSGSNISWTITPRWKKSSRISTHPPAWKNSKSQQRKLLNQSRRSVIWHSRINQAIT